MKKLFLGTALVLCLALPAQAVTVNVADVGASGTTVLQGYVDVNGNAVSIPGLTGTLFLEYDGVTNGGLTWNFDYTVTNTTSGNVTASRISSFGLSTTPNITGATSTGLFDLSLVNPSFPNVQGPVVSGSALEVCFSSGSNSCSGGDGLLKGQSASGEFTLTFATALSAISLDHAFLRFQSIDGSAYAFNGASGVGFDTGGVVITPQAVPGPMLGAGLPGLLAACGGLIALARRRRRAA